MTGFNTQLSAECISLLNLVMALCSLVQFKYLCNQVDDCAGNEVSPAKQARGDIGKERKLHRWQNGEKTLGETRLSRGASSPPARRISSLFQLQQSQSVRAPLVPGVFPRWMSRWWGSHWRSVSGAHLCVLDSTMYHCDNDPGSHKEVHKHWSEVGVQKDVYLEQMCK